MNSPGGRHWTRSFENSAVRLSRKAELPSRCASIGNQARRGPAWRGVFVSGIDRIFKLSRRHSRESGNLPFDWGFPLLQNDTVNGAGRGRSKNFGLRGPASLFVLLGKSTFLAHLERYRADVEAGAVSVLATDGGFSLLLGHGCFRLLRAS